jgi:AraC family transcriptional regulator
MPFPIIEPAATILRAEWDGLQVEYGRLDLVGEFDFAMPRRVIGT